MALETGNNELKPKREIYIDLLRIAASFGVIILHISALNMYDTSVKTFNWQIMNIYDSLVQWTVPIFVMISGALHLQSYSIKEDFFIEKHKIYKKIIKIICAIIFWTIIYHTFFPIMGYLFKGKNPFEIIVALKNAIQRAIFGPGYYHLWFLYMIIGLYLITPILIRFITNAQKKHIEYTIMLFFLLGSCVLLYNTVNIMFDNIVSWFPTTDIYFPFPEFTGYTGYYIAGYYFSKYNLKKRNKTILFILSIVSILFTILTSAAWSIYKNEPHCELYGYFQPNQMIISFALFVLVKDILSGKLFEKHNKIIISISEMTFGIYLIHDLLLQIMNKLGLNSLTFNPLVSIPTIAVIDFIIGLIITTIIKKIPLLKKYVV